jgi:DNA-binding transcriptional MerR regulator
MLGGVTEPVVDRLSARQFAARLGIKPYTLYTYVRRGLLPPPDFPETELSKQAWSLETVERVEAERAQRREHGWSRRKRPTTA